MSWGQAATRPDREAAAFVRAADELGGGYSGAAVFDIPGEAASVDDIVVIIRRYVPAAVLDAAGPLLPITLPQTLSDIRASLPGITRTSLDAGLRATVERYRAAAPR